MADRKVFEPIRTRRAFEEVCEQIRESIQSGAFSAGDRLPSERELAEQFAVSRTTVREAFRTLEIGGLLSLRKGVRGGAVLMRGNSSPINRTMLDLLVLGGLSLEDYTEARVCIQREIIRLACERATDEDFAALDANIAELRKAGSGISGDERSRLTEGFYTILARATRNSAMTIIMSAFTEPLSFYLKQIGPDRTWDVAESRAKFIEHLRRRDPEAAEAEMVRHMQRLHAYLISQRKQEAINVKPDPDV